MPDHVVIYKDVAGEWRWKRTAENGEQVSESGEGYVNKDHALFMATKLNPDVEVTDDG